MIKISPLSSQTRLRAEHNTSSTVLFDNYGQNDIIYGDEIWVAEADMLTSSGYANKVGDKWLHVVSVNGNATSGWMAIIHLGEEICRIIPDVVFVPEKTIKLVYPNGQEFFYDLRAS